MKAVRRTSLEVVALLVAAVVFIVPFIFMFLTASKNESESSDLTFSLPTEWRIIDNIKDAFEARDGILVTAFRNSIILTVVSVAILVVLCAMVGYVIQRRPGKVANIANLLVLSGLIIPPAVVPTIWVLQQLHLFKTLPGLILVEVAFTMSFCVLLFRAFVAAIPRELDEAAMIDGCTGLGAVLPGDLPAAAPRDDHRDPDVVGLHLQRLRQPAVLPARRRERHRAADALQLPEPVQHAVQPALHGHRARHHPAAGPLHLLQPQDRRRHDLRRGEGLTHHARPCGTRGISDSPARPASRSERQP